ncbi:MarR family winged helix-turn-helix transcriptional regulator [Streptacidiphilus monticola]|uniref:MarR family winged helix-turn-helix transcriptional regulator n=1 Tax=Streptacidiphilus monticola TaxID=2161674 RepID=A0ABW1G2T0_9ACTN
MRATPEEAPGDGGHAAGSATRPATDGETLADAAALGEEMARFMRLVGAWKQRMRDENGGDRLLLARLVRQGPRRATDLAAETFLDLSTVSRQVRCLVERGLVARRPDPDDRRGALLIATEAGQDAFAQYRAERNRQMAEVLGSWPEDERHELVRLLTRLNDDFAEYHARAAVPQLPVQNQTLGAAQ